MSVPKNSDRADQPVLEVEGLRVDYRSGRRWSPVVTDVSFTVDRGTMTAVVGESGSGKSTVAASIARLHADGTARVRGAIRIDGIDVLALPERSFRPMRGTKIAYVPQDPASALNPVRTVGSQVAEAVSVHSDVSRADLADSVVALLNRVHVPAPERVAALHPHQLSGGMLQRVTIAMAIASDPSLLIADEPTSGLDATVQRAILDLLQELQRERDLTVVLITHDLAIARDRSDRILVVHNGGIVEQGTVAEVVGRPREPYTRALLSDAPALRPDRFRRPPADSHTRSAVELRSVSKEFSSRRGSFTAVRNVEFSVRSGTTHALVGESGAGKSTIGRMLTRVEIETSGDIVLGGSPVPRRQSLRELRSTRRHLQFVPQNPYLSLDPRFTVAECIAEPLRNYRVGSTAERRRRTEDLADRVGLDRALMLRRPAHLSGGQRQRVAIARALAIEPTVVVLDEPTSALDVTTQARICELLVELQDSFGLTYVFITHDLALVRQLASTVTVLRSGSVVETGSVDEVFESPRAAYTRELLSSIPGITTHMSRSTREELQL